MASWSEPAQNVDEYMAKLSSFARPIVERLRSIIKETAPHLEEAIRWNSPSYKGKLLVCGFSAFQKHVLFTFWRGAELDDPMGYLIHGQGQTPMRSVKYTDMAQVNEKMIKAWLKQAVKLDQTGEPVVRKSGADQRPIHVPEAFQKALAMRKNAAARKTFEGLSPSCRREYCEWIAGAKQEETLQRRIAKSLEKLAAGEGLNDTYRP